ncbi:hypothetical protein LJR039_000274 [Pseudorhodoferax sp. LjRoot39]|uniref:hypothetical protein n=1 Tax=Pseudorhodoferax sp. LjRoot39 TaxID=3342328 RepID=UPI003ECFB1AB
MSQFTKEKNRVPLGILAISCSIVLISFFWQGNKGFNLWDEGYLWYGVQRVLIGEVPLRDFMAYDPGRYYWSAALIRIWGDNGIMSVRATVATFQAAGLFVGLSLVAQSRNFKSRTDIVFWLIAAATFMVWMFPRHKLFDISISIFLIGILTYLVSKPTPGRYFTVGVCVGLTAVFGRNHGIYGAIGSLGVISWLSIKNSSAPSIMKAGAIWGAGVPVGFAPIIFMSTLVPGFAIALWESVRFLFEHQATNLPLPIPWPWTVSFATASVGDATRGALIGIFFIGTLVFGGLSILFVVYRKFVGRPPPPALAASAFIALPYAHYAFSRADVGHLAHGVFPLLVGSLVLLASAPPKIKWPFTLALCGASFWVMHVFHPGWQCLASKQCVEVEIAGKNLQVDQGTAREIALLRQLEIQFAPNGQAFIATPFWPGAYALLERKSPTWEIYALFSRPEIFEQQEINRIKAAQPGFALILDIPLDGRDELRFKNTHPLTNKYIIDNFYPAPISAGPEYRIYTPKNQ